LKGDSFTKNHFVPETSKKFMLPSSDAIGVTFERLVVLEDGTRKYARAKVNIDYDTWMKEIVNKYNLPLQGRWEVYDSSKKRNVPYSGGFE